MQPLELEQKATNRSSPSSLVRSMEGFLAMKFEKEITHEEAENLFKLCKGGMIEKERFFIKSGEHTFEVDEIFMATTKV